MIKKILSIIAVIILILLPFFPFLEDIFGLVTNDNLVKYLTANGVIILILIVLATFVKKNKGNQKSKLNLGNWLLLLLGIVIMIPLHMGPPKQNEDLLKNTQIEHLRYALLLLAVLIFIIGIGIILKSLWLKLKTWEKAIMLPIIVALPILLWEYSDSFTHSEQLSKWIAEGKKMEDFFFQFNFHQNWRAAAKILIYLITGWLGIILTEQSLIKKWAAILINLYCITGIIFCFLFVNKGMEYYFPFMVPAIALASTYWTGLALICTKKSKKIK